MTEQIDLDALEESARRYGMSRDEQATLIAIARAAQAAGPWPHLYIDHESSEWRCEDCFQYGDHLSKTGLDRDKSGITHLDDCRGVALANALAAIAVCTGT